MPNTGNEQPRTQMDAPDTAHKSQEAKNINKLDVAGGAGGLITVYKQQESLSPLG